jgi:hypothetical protein
MGTAFPIDAAVGRTARISQFLRSPLLTRSVYDATTMVVHLSDGVKRGSVWGGLRRTVKRNVAARSPFHSAGRYVGPHRHLSASCFPKATEAANESLSLSLGYTSLILVPEKLFPPHLPHLPLSSPAASASATRPDRPIEAWYRAVATLDATWVGVKEVRRKSLRHRAISRPIRREPARDSKRLTKNWSNAKRAPDSRRKTQTLAIEDAGRLDDGGRN